MVNTPHLFIIDVNYNKKTDPIRDTWVANLGKKSKPSQTLDAIVLRLTNGEPYFVEPNDWILIGDWEPQ